MLDELEQTKKVNKMNVYELKDLSSGQTLKGSAEVIERMLKVNQSTVRKYARNGQILKRRYQVRLVECNEEKHFSYKPDGQVKTGCSNLLKDWDEIHKIAQEVKAGLRVIVRCGDGKRYAVRRCRIDESRE